MESSEDNESIASEEVQSHDDKFKDNDVMALNVTMKAIINNFKSGYIALKEFNVTIITIQNKINHENCISFHMFWVGTTQLGVMQYTLYSLILNHLLVIGSLLLVTNLLVHPHKNRTPPTFA